MDIIIGLLNQFLLYLKYEIINGTFNIYVESSSIGSLCPFCGDLSLKKHSFYYRKFQNLPIQGVQVIFILKTKRFFCNNTKCNHNFFAERFDFIESYVKKSNRLKEKILEISMYLSSVSACEILNSNFIKICKSTVFNILKRNSQKELLISELKHICIDDLALKKATTYGTVMIDCNTHRIVDMIDSREVSDVKEWLKLYPNIQVVCRDDLLDIIKQY